MTSTSSYNLRKCSGTQTSCLYTLQLCTRPRLLHPFLRRLQRLPPPKRTLSLPLMPSPHQSHPLKHRLRPLTCTQTCPEPKDHWRLVSSLTLGLDHLRKQKRAVGMERLTMSQRLSLPILPARRYTPCPRPQPHKLPHPQRHRPDGPWHD